MRRGIAAAILVSTLGAGTVVVAAGPSAAAGCSHTADVTANRRVDRSVDVSWRSLTFCDTGPISYVATLVSTAVLASPPIVRQGGCVTFACGFVDSFTIPSGAASGPVCFVLLSTGGVPILTATPPLVLDNTCV